MHRNTRKSPALGRLALLFGIAVWGTAANAALIGIDSYTNTLIEIDTTTGAATAISDRGALAHPYGYGLMAGIAHDTGSDTLYSAELYRRDFVTIDDATGQVQPVGTTGNAAIWAMAHDPLTDTLYGFDGYQRALVTIDQATGATMTAVGMRPAFGLAFDPTRDTLYGTALYGELFSIDVASGYTQLVPTRGYYPHGLFALTMDPTTGTLWGSDRSRLWRLDPIFDDHGLWGFEKSRVGSAFGHDFQRVEALAYISEATSIPIASTVSLMATGLAGLILGFRRRDRLTA